MKKLLVSVLVLMVIFAGCGKDKDPDPTPPPPPPPPQPTVQDTLLGWKVVNMGQSGHYDVWFTSKQQGLLLTDNGIYRTSNEGVNWSRVDEGGSFANLYFLNAQYGYAQGRNFAYTTNGGATWVTHQNVMAAIDYRDLFFTTPSTGYVTGPTGLYKSVDTGRTWQQIRPGNINGIFFSNANNGWIVDAGKLYKTTDAGATWQLVTDLQMATPLIAVLQFTDALHAKFCAGPTFAKSDDGGATWTKKQFGVDILDIHFLDNNLGYLTTNHEIFVTIDGGSTWTRSAKIGGQLVELFFVDGNNGWACGGGGLLQWKR